MFVSNDETNPLGNLALLLGQPAALVLRAGSVACRLGFARKVSAPPLAAHPPFGRGRPPPPPPPPSAADSRGSDPNSAEADGYRSPERNQLAGPAGASALYTSPFPLGSEAVPASESSDKGAERGDRPLVTASRLSSRAGPLPRCPPVPTEWDASWREEEADAAGAAGLVEGHVLDVSDASAPAAPSPNFGSELELTLGGAAAAAAGDPAQPLAEGSTRRTGLLVDSGHFHSTSASFCL